MQLIFTIVFAISLVLNATLIYRLLNSYKALYVITKIIEDSTGVTIDDFIKAIETK